jgi:hypothetical protein
MAFLQDLGKNIGKVASDAQKKTSELIEINKLNSAIKDEKEAIAEVHKKIGMTMYAMYAAGDPVPETVATDVQTIAGKLQNIINLEAKIVDLKKDEPKPSIVDTQQQAYAAQQPYGEHTVYAAQQPPYAEQPVYGAPQPPYAEQPVYAAQQPPYGEQTSAPYSPPMQEPFVPVVPVVGLKFCTNCGSQMNPGMTFCSQCGQKNG